MPILADRHFPVRPDLDQLRHQAKDLLRAIRRGDADAVGTLSRHTTGVTPETAQLHDAQLALARSYGLPSWTRLVLACRMTDAIWRDDRLAVADLIKRHPALLTEDARGVKGNWGPPMSYAANLGRDEIVTLLRDQGASDLEFALDRATLQGQIGTARHLMALGATPPRDAAMGPCETLEPSGLALLVELGVPLTDAHGDRLAPVGMVLETYGRQPQGKHECLEIFAANGIELPDTPPMALHRGRIDLLEAHLVRDPALFARTFAHSDIYPLTLGCHADPRLALHGTPLDGTTLLHMAVDYDEVAIIRWMLERGADVNVRAAVDADGFGGHTAFFGCVVSQPFRVRARRDDAVARLLLDAGADLTVRASLRKELRFVDDETLHEYRNVTPLEWGEQFHDQDWVSTPVMALLRAR